MAGELRNQALEDLDQTLQGEFGQRVRVANKDGSLAKNFVGQTTNIGSIIDFSTGTQVSGTAASVVLKLDEVERRLKQLPESLWTVQFLEIGKSSTKYPNGTPPFKIKDVMPDRSLGLVTLILGE